MICYPREQGQAYPQPPHSLPPLRWPEDNRGETLGEDQDEAVPPVQGNRDGQVGDILFTMTEQERDEFDRGIRAALVKLRQLEEQLGGDREKAAVCMMLDITPEQLARVCP